MRWKLKSPDAFPEFDRAMSELKAAIYEGFGELGVDLGLGKLFEKNDAKQFADKFRAYRYCLRAYPLHRWADLERDYVLKTREVDKTRDGARRVVLYAYKRVDLAALLDATKK